MLKTCFLTILALNVFTPPPLSAAGGSDRPNILWLTCEDISPYLGCYGFEQAETPNLDGLAAQGVRFTRAYSHAPVCAVARSSILTGMHSSTLGTQNMRGSRPLPPGIPAYPREFRKNGYYTTNNKKKDYNSSLAGDESLWNESSAKAHWRNRPANSPFFAVFNLTTTHEGRLEFAPEKSRIPLDQIELPPYHPDLPEVRQDWARLHDLITMMDKEIGQHLRDLEEAGLADNTIVFFYSDHGGMLSRSKRYIYNGGTQVPLIVRVPRKWKHLSPGKPGTTFDELTGFVDLPKTVLSLAGLDIPEKMVGRILFGPNREKAPATLHFYRDRMAERFDLCRAVTDGRYYYIRNFMPHRPRGRDTTYGYKVQPNWGAWADWHDNNPEAANARQSQFFTPKPLVQFFDMTTDPWQIENLAGQPDQEERVKQLETDLEAWMIETRDTGLIPEAMLCQLTGKDYREPTVYEYAQSDAYPVERALEAAKTASRAGTEGSAQCLKLLVDDHPVIRYWGAYGLFLHRKPEDAVKKALRHTMINDGFAANRIMAAQALALCGDADTAFPAMMREVKDSKDGYVYMLGLNALQYSHTDDRLKKTDWESFLNTKPTRGSGWSYAKRIAEEALAIWPNRQKVD